MTGIYSPSVHKTGHLHTGLSRQIIYKPRVYYVSADFDWVSRHNGFHNIGGIFLRAAVSDVSAVKYAVTFLLPALDLGHTPTGIFVEIQQVEGSAVNIFCRYDMVTALCHRENANQELECDVIGFDGEARKTLLTHAWPGNVRELRQKIMGAVLQAQTGLVTKEHLELAVTRATSPVSFALRSDAEDKERILRALKQANGNRKVAAELLGIGRTTLYNKLEEYGLKYKFQQP